MKFFQKNNKKKFLIISPIIFLGIILFSFRSISKRENINYWLKENFTGGYVFFFNTKNLMNKSFYNIYYKITDIVPTLDILNRNYEGESNKPLDIYTEEIDSFLHKIVKEVIPAKDYLTANVGGDLPGIPGGYFEFIDNENIIVTNGIGKLFTYNFENKEFKALKSNLNQIYEKQDFKGKVIRNLFGRFGIKDLYWDKPNGKLYASMTVENEPNSACYAMGIFKADLTLKTKFDEINNLNFEEFFKMKSCHKHFNGHATGGRIKAFKGKILFTVGDLDHNIHGDRKIAQNKTNAVGKVIAINKNGTFEVLSSGHRNPQGLYVLGEDIFITEHGPKGGDEINLIKKGKHYGWPYYSYGFAYSNDDIFRQPHTNGYEKPIYYFAPSIATSEISFYKEDQFNRWKNKFIVGGLASKSLWLLDYDMENKRVMSQEKIYIGHRVRDFGISKDGIIVVITDDQKIIRLKKSNIPKWNPKNKIRFL